MLSTIHTNNSIGVIPRLIDLGVQPFLLSSALNLMIAQRLVLRLCPSCKKPHEAVSDVQEIIEKELSELPADVKKTVVFKKPYTVYQAAPKPDCQVCKGKGTAGRMALFEFFQMTRELSDLVNTGFTEGKLWDLAKRQGIVTLRQDGILKALAGDTAIESVLQETT
jgi:type II secretory ATPase GspE/PulE/Tfp pilus assembly ATPase PilB-like protein